MINRRTFLKGMAALSITPFMPSIPVNLESIEHSSLHWTSKSSAEIVEDIQNAIDAIRFGTGQGPDTLVMSSDMAERIEFDVDSLPDEITTVRFV